MSEWAAKRFWKETSVSPCEGGFEITLDGRGVRTPAKAPLVVPTRAFADRIAAEWEAQEDKIDPTEMPATRAANAAIDKVTAQFDEVVHMLSDYGDSDLLCYRADSPQELVDRQKEAWDPVLDWASSALDARLEPRTGVIHAPQDPAALAALRSRVGQMTAFELAAFHDLVTISGSLILGFAVTENHLSADAAWAASQLDETYQAEVWGADDEASDAAAKKEQSFLNAAIFYREINFSAEP